MYAHYDTGHYTAAPRQVVPGEPAKAGKSLERAIKGMAITNRSSASLSSLGAISANPMARDSLGIGSGTFSRPGTPFSHSRPTTPSPRGSSFDLGISTQLRSDNDLLRGLVQSNQREKNAMMDTIESLQTSSAAQTDSFNGERAAWAKEREALHATIKKLQFPTGVNPYAQQGFTASSRSASAATFSAQNPFGAIGSGNRATSGTSSRPDTPIDTPADSPILQPRTYVSPGGNGRQTFNMAPAPTQNGPPSGLNPHAPTYGNTPRFGQNGSFRAGYGVNDGTLAIGAEDESVLNVPRPMGHRFWVRTILESEERTC